MMRLLFPSLFSPKFLPTIISDTKIHQIRNPMRKLAKPHFVDYQEVKITNRQQDTVERARASELVQTEPESWFCHLSVVKT